MHQELAESYLRVLHFTLEFYVVIHFAYDLPGHNIEDHIPAADSKPFRDATGHRSAHISIEIHGQNCQYMLWRSGTKPTVPQLHN